MGNTFSRCWRAVCVPPSFTEDGSAEWTESVEWTDVCDPAWCEEITEMSEDRSAPKVGEKEKLFPARGHDEQDMELEDVWHEDIQINFLPCELEDKKQDPSKTDDVDKPVSSRQTNDVGASTPRQTSDEGASTPRQTSDVGASTPRQTSDVGASTPRQTSDEGASTPRQTRMANQAHSPKLGVAPGQSATTTLSDDKQTLDSLKAQEKQSLLTDDDYSHLSEVQQHLVQEIEAALQEEMQRVFPQETITSLLPELRHTILREIQLPFLQQIEFCALLDRQEEELVALDKQLEREKLNHDIMFVLSQDCSKPPGIQEGQAERFGKRRRRRRNGTTDSNSETNYDAAVPVRGRTQMTGIG